MKLSYADERDPFIKGADGLPSDYPIPSEEVNMAFYIQKNQNQNTVVYQLNVDAGGFINVNKPLNVYWKEYEDQGKYSNINFLQERLAYGYTHKVINNETIQVSIVSYPTYKMYITRKDDNFVVVSKFNEVWEILTNIYVFADDHGAFPNVEYIELYGKGLNDESPKFEKLNISK